MIDNSTSNPAAAELAAIIGAAYSRQSWRVTATEIPLGPAEPETPGRVFLPGNSGQKSLLTQPLNCPY
jgi:hypothetical protein